MEKPSRRQMIVKSVGAAVLAFGAAPTQAQQKKASAKEIRDLMKALANFDPEAIEAVTDELVEKQSRMKAQEVKAPKEYDGARYVVEGTGLQIHVGQWTWYGPGCLGNDYYVYNVKPGATYRYVGKCTANGKHLYNINVV